jgi:hypothetical protein
MHKVECVRSYPFLKSKSFLRVAILSERIKKPVSEILGITDKYISFCLEETSHYVYNKAMEKSRNEKELKEMMNKTARKKK